MSPEDYSYFVGTTKNKKGIVIFGKTDVVYFGIAQVLGKYLEEERIMLSSKLSESRPFFETLAPTYYEWNNLKAPKAANFEKIVELLLQQEKSLEKIVPLGKTNASDRGRDFDVTEKISTMNKGEKKKWLVQCKFSKNSISPNILSGWVDRVVEHDYDGYWLITNNDVTPSLFDQFKDVELNPKYEIETRLWQRSDLHIKMNLYDEIITGLKLFN